MVEEKLVYREQPLFFVERVQESDNVYTYVFQAQTPVSYTAGQYGHVRVHGMPEGVRAVREFSFFSAPHESEIRFGVDMRSGSDYQKRFDALRNGDSVGLFKIKQHMTWPPRFPSSYPTLGNPSGVVREPPSTEEVVMIAGGIGITPFRSMLADRKQKNLPVETTLLHVSRGAFAYETEIRELADCYIPIHGSGFAEQVLQTASEQPSAIYYVAGSPRFVEAVQLLLSARGIVPQSDPFKGLQD